LGKTNIRIKDIAEKAGVSTGTVDRVLHKRGRVSPVAEKKVLEVIEALNYQPNFIARALGANKNYTLAVLMPDPALDPYWSAPQKGLEAAAADYNSHGITIEKFIYNQNEVQSFADTSERIFSKKFDGVIVAPLFFQQYLPFAKKCGEENLPLVLFNTNIKEVPKLSFIGQDSYQSGRLGAHLLSTGLRLDPGEILLLHLADDLENSAHLMRKEEGFKDYFEQQEGRQRILAVNIKSPINENLVNHLDALLDNYQDIKAFFVTTSKAYEVAAYLEGVGLQDKLLVGFDLIEENISYLNKGVIDFIINQNAYRQGYQSIESFVDFLVLKKEVNDLLYLPLDVITKENVKYYLPQA